MSNFEKEIAEKAMKKTMELMKEKGADKVTQEDLLEAAKEIAKETGLMKETAPAEQEGEIAVGSVEKEEVIGGGIVAEPEHEIAKEEEKEDDFIIRFSKPYRFEGKTYAGVDLSGLKNLKAKDLWKVNRNYRNAGNVSVLPEIDAEYTARVAAMASNLPIEFFENMPLYEATKIKAKVSGFFMEKE